MADYQQMQQNVQDVISSKRMDGNMNNGASVAGGMKYKILNTHNPSYDPMCALKLDLMFKGGKNILEQAKLFLPKALSENPVVYKERLGYASYHNHLAEIINNYLCDLFSKSLAVLPAADATEAETVGEVPQAPEFYQEFAKDADLSEHSFEQVLKDVAERALTQGVGYLGLDFPNPEELDQAFLEKEMAEISLEDEEEFGLSRAYVYSIPYESVIDWQLDDYNKFTWCVLKNETINRKSFKEGRTSKTIKFKIWYYNEAGDVAYECYEREYRLDEMPNENDEFPMVDEGTVSFKRIPIKCFCVPDGLWIGNQLYPILLENFKLRSMINFSESRAANEIPFYQQAAEETRNPVSENESRGENFRANLINKGFLVGTANDKLSFVGPKGEIFKVLHEQLKDNVNEMHRIHHMMASTIASKGTSTSSSRSGIAKQTDNDAKAKVLTQYALLVKDFAKEIYDDIADGRNEDIMWQCIGMTDFEVWEKADLIEEAKSTNEISQVIPSKTFKKMQLTQLAFRLIPDVNPETMLVIKNEIDQALDSMAGMSMPPTDNPNSNPDNYDPLADKQQPKAQQLKTEAAHHREMGDHAIADTLEAALGPGGQPLLPEGSHLQTGEHVDAQVVYDQLAEDYDEKDIQFVLHIPWIGPVEVPLSSIDFSNKDNWQASQEEDAEHVDMFADKMKNDNYTKPVILVNMPHNDDKMMVVDGHHRSLAALQNGQPVMAYVGMIGTKHGPWDVLHANQKGGGSVQESAQESNQVNETSIQKEASQQVGKSEKAKGGKTK